MNNLDIYKEYAIKVRRHIHSYPETGFDVHNTINFIASELDKLNVKYYRNIGISSLVAVIEGNNKGSIIGIRADVDALDLQEENDVVYKSKIDGKMHGCGHDAHAAILLTLIKYIIQENVIINGTLKCIFQAAEEGPTSGGKLVCEDKIMDDVDVFFALHVDPSIETGKIGLKYGEFNASCDDFEIILKGKGGHAAYPQYAIDPIAMAFEIYSAVNIMKNREIDQVEKLVISFCVINSGTTNNVIPEMAVLKGTVRTYNNELRQKIKEKMTNIIKGITSIHNAKYEFNYVEDVVPLINTPEVCDFLKDIIITNVGEENLVIITQPSMGGEDFAYYTQKAKGAMFTLGTRNMEKGITESNHNPKFDIDEDALVIGVEIFLQTILNYFK